MDKICGNCKFWDFKVSADKSFGRCLNPKVRESIRISLVKCDFGAETADELRRIQTEVKDFAEVQFEENSFGCIHFEPNGEVVEVAPFILSKH